MLVWGIASREPHELVAHFRDQLGLTFPILEDTNGAVVDTYAQLTAFESTVYPQDWIIGADGTVRYVNNGYQPDEWALILEAELGGSR